MSDRFDGMSFMDIFYSCGSSRPTWPPIGLAAFTFKTKDDVEREQKNYDECMAELRKRIKVTDAQKLMDTA